MKQMIFMKRLGKRLWKEEIELLHKPLQGVIAQLAPCDHREKGMVFAVLFRYELHHLIGEPLTVHNHHMPLSD